MCVCRSIFLFDYSASQWANQMPFFFFSRVWLSATPFLVEFWNAPCFSVDPVWAAVCCIQGKLHERRHPNVNQLWDINKPSTDHQHSVRFLVFVIIFTLRIETVMLCSGDFSLSFRQGCVFTNKYFQCISSWTLCTLHEWCCLPSMWYTAVTLCSIWLQALWRMLTAVKWNASLPLKFSWLLEVYAGAFD